MKLRALAISLAFALSAVACGGAGGQPKTPASLTSDQIDADPLALLPPSPIALASVDAKAFYASGDLGAQLAKIVEKLAPVGDDFGFQASRDVDRAVAGLYGSEGADVVAVVSGRFDEAKVEAAVAEHKTTKNGGVILDSQYAGHHVFTVGGGGVSILTPKTALAGTQAGIQRALDRVQQAKTTHDAPQWMLDTLATPNAAAAAAVDLQQPGAAAAIGSVPVPTAKSAKTARAVADFKPPGMHVALTVEYADAQAASQAAGSLKQAASLEGLAALTGLAPKLQGLAIAATDTNVQAQFAVDDASMRKLALLAAQLASSK